MIRTKIAKSSLISILFGLFLIAILDGYRFGEALKGSISRKSRNTDTVIHQSKLIPTSSSSSSSLKYSTTENTRRLSVWSGVSSE